jgi:hypothetical protein
MIGKHVVQKLSVVRLGTSFEQQTGERFGVRMGAGFLFTPPEHSRQRRVGVLVPCDIVRIWIRSAVDQRPRNGHSVVRVSAIGSRALHR